MWTGSDVPYQDLPPLPPSTQVETPAVLKEVIAASRALAALDQAVRRLPDPTMLVHLLPVLEAQASSEIENVVTTNDELFRAAADMPDTRTSPAVKEALRYRRALWVGFDSLQTRPLTSGTALEICSELQGRTATLRNQPSAYIGNPVNRERIYTPPKGADVIAEHLSRWERFLHADSGFDPLVVMAMQHYQFEAIHPFFDGNGRTGRVINLLLLVEKGLLEQPVLYLSGHIVRTKDEYYSRLRAVTAQDDWQGWILYMVGAVGATARWTLSLVEVIEGLRREAEDAIRRHLPAQAPASDLARVLFAQPYVRIEAIVDAGLAKRQTASKWLSVLAQHDVLERQQLGRSVVYLNRALLDTLAEATDR